MKKRQRHKEWRQRKRKIKEGEREKNWERIRQPKRQNKEKQEDVSKYGGLIFSYCKYVRKEVWLDRCLWSKHGVWYLQGYLMTSPYRYVGQIAQSI